MLLISYINNLGMGNANKKGEIHLFESLYMPILMYGAETCTWTKADISRLMAVEMRLLSVEGKTKERE
jgi:hypothetical protein